MAKLTTSIKCEKCGNLIKYKKRRNEILSNLKCGRCFQIWESTLDKISKHKKVVGCMFNDENFI